MRATGCNSRRTRWDWERWRAGFATTLLGLCVVLGGSGTVFGQAWPDFPQSIDESHINPWPNRWFVRTEFLAMWAKGNRIPPLLTTSPSDTPAEDAGVLGEPGTEILVGDERLKDKGRLGTRITLGHWLDAAHRVSVEGQWWILGKGEDLPGISSEGDPILARPFFNTELGGQDAHVLAFPDALAGGLRADFSSEVHSAHFMGRYALREGPGGFLEVFGGYRFFSFREGVRLEETLVPDVQLTDKFRTDNVFHGTNFGTRLALKRHNWQIDLSTTIALGNMHQTLDVKGTTQAGDTTLDGGFLALPSNIGFYSRDELAIIPDFEIRFQYFAFNSIRLMCGYKFMVVSDLLRVGDQIDTTINPSQLPAGLPLARGTAGEGMGDESRPAIVDLNDTAAWLQGVSFGIEMRW